MKMFDAVYKCRLCGEEFVKCSTSGEESNRSFVMKIMCRAVDLKEPEEFMEPTIYACHPCRDGSYGVADFRGFKFNDKENAE